MSDSGIDPASQPAYYLPALNGAAQQEEHTYDDDSMTESATVRGSATFPDRDDESLLSDLTQVGGQPVTTYSAASTQGQSVFQDRLGNLPNSVPLFGELLPAFTVSVNHPIVRGANRSPDNLHDPRLQRDEVTDQSGIERAQIEDFFRLDGGFIEVQGTTEALFDLDILTLRLIGGFARQLTPGHDWLCGLYALVISVNAKLAPVLVARGEPPFTVADIEKILEHRAYKILCAQEMYSMANGLHPVANTTFICEAVDLLDRHNLSVEQLTLLVYIVGEMIGHQLQLGVVSPAPDAQGHNGRLYKAYQRNRHDNAGVTTIWMVNEGTNDTGSNRWSGMAPNANHSEAATGVTQRADESAMQQRRDVQLERVASLLSQDLTLPSDDTVTATPLEATVSPPLPTAPHVDGIYCPREGCKSHSSATPPKPFTHKQALRRHMATVHLPYENRRFVCTLCRERFVYNKDLRRHRESMHTGNNTWCLVETCSKLGPAHATRGDNLKRHYRTFHWNDVELWETCMRHFRLKRNGQPLAAAAATAAS